MAHLGPSLRRAKVQERPWVRAALALLASLALNTLLVLLLARWGAFTAPGRQASPVALAPISSERWAANRAIRTPAAKPGKSEPLAKTPAPKPREPEAERSPKGQVVDIARPDEQKAPRESRFLSEYDSSVEKQTRSRHARPGYERTLPVPSAPGVRTGPPPGQGGRSDRFVPGTEGEVANVQPDTPRRAAPAQPERGDLESRRGSRVAAAPPGAAGRESAPAPAGPGEGGLRSRGMPDALQVSPGTLARLAGGPAPDYLEGLEEGEGTWLNTRSWKYASYFNRMKEAVVRAWDPITPYEARDPDGSIYGTRERRTVCNITLDDRGNLRNVKIAQSSGLEFLDLAAVKAFETAAPFPNPPRGVVDPNGEVRFPFALILDVRRGSRINVQLGPGVWPMMPGLPTR